MYTFKFEPSDYRLKSYDSDTIEILASLPRFSKEEKDLLKIAALNALNGSRARPSDMITANKDYVKSFNKTSFEDTDTSDSKENQTKNLIHRLYHEIKKIRPSFDSIINPYDLLTNFICLPNKNNSRIIRQSGAFIVYGLVEESITEGSDSNKIGYEKKIIVDGTNRKSILDQLRFYGMTKGSVYPELFKVAEYIKENISKPHL